MGLGAEQVLIDELEGQSSAERANEEGRFILRTKTRSSLLKNHSTFNTRLHLATSPPTTEIRIRIPIRRLRGSNTIAMRMKRCNLFYHANGNFACW